MTAWYADRLRDQAGDMERRLDALRETRHYWQKFLDNAADPDSVACDVARQVIDGLSDEIGELEGEVEELDEIIDAEDGERPYRPILV